MLVFAHSRSLFDKFSGDGKPLARVDLADAQTLGRAGPTAATIDAVQCKRISVQNKPTRKGGSSSRRRRPRFFNRQKRLDRRKSWLPARPCLDNQILPSYGIVLSPPAV
jgi:hypothetical protein